jgi:hypothetical protein
MSNKANTSLKILLNDWIAMRQIIHSTGISAHHDQSMLTENDPSLSLLSDEAIFNAFQGPYHELVNSLAKAYALLTKLRAYTVVTQDENLKTHIKQPETLLDKRFNSAVNAAQLDKIQLELDQLAQTLFKEWHDHLGQAQSQILLQLMSDDIALNEYETQMLTTNQTVSDLECDINERQLKMIKRKASHYSFREYVHAQLLICLHSALARQLKPHSSPDLDKQMKRFQAVFKELDQTQKKCVKILDDQVATILKKLT